MDLTPLEALFTPTHASLNVIAVVVLAISIATMMGQVRPIFLAVGLVISAAFLTLNLEVIYLIIYGYVHVR